MRCFAITAALLLTACPEQIGQQCPPNTALVGQYTLAFTGQHDAGECIASTDAGPVKLTPDDGGVKGATLCLGTADGGPQLDLVVAGKGGVFRSELRDGGAFRFTSGPVSASGTACNCDLDEVETFEGVLLTAAADGGFSLQPDGGLPPIDGVAGTLIDSFSAASSALPCLCAIPCTATFSISGTRF